MYQDFLNLSEHKFNLSFSEILLFKQFSNKFSCEICSNIGGCESIRDLQQSKILNINTFEFQFIESTFALTKIISSINNVFNNSSCYPKNLKIFISIGSEDGLNIYKDIYFNDLIEKNLFECITFTFDRRYLCKNLFKLKNNNFEVYEYSEEIDKRISKFLNENQNRKFKVAISGGIDLKEINKNQEKFRKFDFIKTGLFTIKVDKEIDIINKIKERQLQEKQILQTMKEIIIQKNIYISSRFSHLKKYIESFK
tara:strand:+ start:6241 stop:7002 length:762 start_codon:yes stop_codon:yes gene_type:complete